MYFPNCSHCKPVVLWPLVSIAMSLVLKNIYYNLILLVCGLIFLYFVSQNPHLLWLFNVNWRKVYWNIKTVERNHILPNHIVLIHAQMTSFIFSPSSFHMFDIAIVFDCLFLYRAQYWLFWNFYTVFVPLLFKTEVHFLVWLHVSESERKLFFWFLLC